MPIPHVMWLEI